jgi:hypothetical protein
VSEQQPIKENKMSTPSLGIHLYSTDKVSGSVVEQSCDLIKKPYPVIKLALGEFEITIWLGASSSERPGGSSVELASVLRTVADDLDKIVARGATVTSIQE